MSELERLKAQLEYLMNQKIGMGSSPSDLGYWLLEIGKLNLEIAALLMKDKE